MIYYRTDLAIPLSEYGITVPVDYKRAEKILSAISVTDICSDNIEIFSQEDLLRVHTTDYVNSLFQNPVRAIADCYKGYCSRQLLDIQASTLVSQILQHAAGTHKAMQLALQTGFCYYLGGGFHHAKPDRGDGFCLIHDIAIAVRKIQQIRDLKVLLIDVDAHKGDGSAVIFAEDSSVVTFSIHMQDGWPLNDPQIKGAQIASTLDIPVSDIKGEEFLRLLEVGINEIYEKFNPFDLVVIIDGMDVWQEDQLASASYLSLSREDILERGKRLFSFFKQKQVAQLYLFGGGYSLDNWQLNVDFFQWLSISNSWANNRLGGRK